MRSHHPSSSQEGGGSQVFAPKGPALLQIVLKPGFKENSGQLHRASRLAGPH